MGELTIRLATLSDINDLVEMRLDFKFEDDSTGATVARPGYEADCRSFLESAIAGVRWQVWVAELDSEVTSHVFVALIDKVPSPIAENSRISYLTNVYTRPAYRGQVCVPHMSTEAHSITISCTGGTPA